MAASCTRTLDLGCFACATGTLTIADLLAPSTGQYTFVFCYAGNEVCKVYDQEEGEPVVVPVVGLNENYRHRFHILDEDGERVTYDDGGTVYDCFSFKLLLPLSNDDVPPAQTCDPVRVEDQDGNLLGMAPAGSTFVVDISGGVVILRYADEAAANAATGVTPTAHQFVFLLDTGRLYVGDGALNVPDLIATEEFLLGVRQEEFGLVTNTNGEEGVIQLNDLPEE